MEKLSEEESLQTQQETLKARLERGEIDGAEYNRLYMAITPTKSDTGDHLRFISRRNAKVKKSWASTMASVMLGLAFIPLIIIVQWKYYFENTLTGEGLPDFSLVQNSSLDAEPVQIDLEEPVIEQGEYREREIEMVYLAYYDMTATVLDKKNYYYYLGLHEGGLFDAVAMSDLCLGWGEMKDILDDTDWRFRNGYVWSPTARYSYKYARRCEPKYLGENYLDAEHPFYAEQFSNNHLIFADKEVRDVVFGLKRGNVVRLVGYLVEVRGENEVISSSLTRDDHSNGGYDASGCEVIYVTKVEVVEESYKDL